MSNRWLCALVLAAPLATGCGVIPDLELGSEVVPPISGSTTIEVPQNYKCGEPISDPANKYVVTSSGDASSCTFTFKQDVTAIHAADYDKRPELQGAQAVNGVDIHVDKFDVRDAATGKRPEGLKSLTGQAFGETILTQEDLSQTPPFVKEVNGPAVEALKAQVQAKQDIVIPVNVVVVVSLTPAPPAKLALDFEAQPVLHIGF